MHDVPDGPVDVVTPSSPDTDASSDSDFLPPTPGAVYSPSEPIAPVHIVEPELSENDIEQGLQLSGYVGMETVIVPEKKKPSIETLTEVVIEKEPSDPEPVHKEEKGQASCEEIDTKEQDIPSTVSAEPPAITEAVEPTEIMSTPGIEVLPPDPISAFEHVKPTVAVSAAIEKPEQDEFKAKLAQELARVAVTPPQTPSRASSKTRTLSAIIFCPFANVGFIPSAVTPISTPTRKRLASDVQRSNDTEVMAELQASVRSREKRRLEKERAEKEEKQRELDLIAKKVKAQEGVEHEALKEGEMGDKDEVLREIRSWRKQREASLKCAMSPSYLFLTNSLTGYDIFLVSLLPNSDRR